MFFFFWKFFGTEKEWLNSLISHALGQKRNRNITGCVGDALGKKQDKSLQRSFCGFRSGKVSG
jgi:hypothetical protein